MTSFPSVSYCILPILFLGLWSSLRHGGGQINKDNPFTAKHSVIYTQHFDQSWVSMLLPTNKMFLWSKLIAAQIYAYRHKFLECILACYIWWAWWHRQCREFLLREGKLVRWENRILTDEDTCWDDRGIQGERNIPALIYYILRSKGNLLNFEHLGQIRIPEEWKKKVSFL